MAIDWQPLFDGVVTFLVLFAIAFLVYTAIKKQNLRDTWDEVMDLFTTAPETAEEVVPF